MADLRKKLGAARTTSLQGTDALAKGEAAVPDAAKLGPDLRDPGAVQLLGGLGDDKYGGGGFFGPNDRSAGTKKGDKFYAESGFNTRSFQIMASYGCEIAATWKTSDAMHFEVEGSVQDIVTPSAAEANPTAAQASGKAFVDQATQAREKYDKVRAK